MQDACPKIMSAFTPCILIPTYNNPATIRGVVQRLRRDLPQLPIIVVDDHSAPEGQKVVEELTAEGAIQSLRLPSNRGKGGALKQGFAFALERGFTNALQIDADGQHCFEDVPRFLQAAEAHPEALILGCPVFDATAPKSRLQGRKISIFWTTLETGGRRIIDDPLCGFRVYPLQPAADAKARTDRMEFDPEIAVRMVWNGTPVLNLPTRVRYLTAEEGGVSHFRPIHDNVMMSLMHTRMVLTLALRKLRALAGHQTPAFSRIDLPADDPLLALPPSDGSQG